MPLDPQNEELEEPVERRLKPMLRGVPDIFATCLALPAVAYLISQVEGNSALLSAVLFGIGLIAVLGMSAVYHAPTWSPRRFEILGRFDHAAIFLLIAGSYTPLCVCTEIPLGTPMLIGVWVICTIGIARCLFFPKSDRRARTVLYVVLGLCLTPSVPALYREVGPVILGLCMTGGALHILGAGIYLIRRPDPFPRHFGYHEVFHLCVFAAAGCHYLAVWEILVH